MHRLRRIVAGLFLLLLVLLVSSWIYNASTSAGNVPARKLWHGKVVRADGVLTAYRSWGKSGPPVVLVGGFVEPSFAWEKVGPLLAARGHRVYALDLDGFGYSERKGPWTLQEWADQVQDFSRAVGARHPVIVGHSLGAAVAVEVARRGAASRVVLLDGDARRGGGAPDWLRDTVMHLPLLTTAFRIATGWDWAVKRVLSDSYGDDHPPLTHAEVDRWTEQFRIRGAEHALKTMVRREIAGFAPEQLRLLKLHAVVAWGEHDDIDSMNEGRATARELHAPFVVIPGTGHLSLLTAPRAVAQVILSGR